MTTNMGPKHQPDALPADVQNQEGKDETGAPFARRIHWIAAKPKKGARLIARTFYRELRRAGWADRDIMAVADELLSCLIVSLSEYRLKKEIPVEEVTKHT